MYLSEGSHTDLGLPLNHLNAFVTDVQKTNLIKQKREITRHFHQVVDLLVCQLLNLRNKAAQLVTVHRQRVNKPYLKSGSF